MGIALKTIMYILTDSILGGSAWALLDMLKEMENSIRPVVIIPGKGLTEERLKQLEIQYYVIPFRIKFCKIGAGSRQLEDSIFREDYAAALQLQPIIDKEKVDLIHTNSSICNVGAIAALLSGKPHIWHLRELLEEHFGCEFVDKELKKELFEHTEEFIAISNCVKEIYEHKFGIHTTCIYDGLELERYLCEEVYHDKGNTFLLVGIINDGKGQWDAVRAVELLVSRGVSQLRLTIVGNGDQKVMWSLKKYIARKKLCDYVYVQPFQHDLSNLRADHTYSLTCSKMEALGRTTIEAILAGNIVIGADTGGTLEIIGNNCERGYLYRQGDYENLAEIMYNVICEEQQAKIGKSRLAKRFVRENFGLREYVVLIMHLYDDVIDRYKAKVSEERDDLIQKMSKRYEGLTPPGKETGGTDEKKFEMMFKYTELWLRIKQQEYSLADFFLKKNIRRIGIYGMGFLGCDLYDELENTDIEIAYVMDREAQTIDKVVPVVSVDEDLPCVDAIVITAISVENKIQEWLQGLCSYTIIRLTEVLESYREMI